MTTGKNKIYLSKKNPFIFLLLCLSIPASAETDRERTITDKGETGDQITHIQGSLQNG
jgi:hypothetical protein